VTLLVYAGLSLGLNPAIDTANNISGLLHHLNRRRQQTGAPTQICVSSHVKTQLACLERGAPVELMFQSVADSERTLTEEFDVTVELLDHAYRAMAEHGPGMDPRYTLHSEITIEGQQMATQLLAAAGANYLVNVQLGVDRMLAYFDTSEHDQQTLREIHGLAPARSTWSRRSNGAYSPATPTAASSAAQRGVTRGPSAPRTPSSTDCWRSCRPPTASTSPARGPPTGSRARCAPTRPSPARRSTPSSTRRCSALSPSAGLVSAAHSRDDHLADPDIGARLAPEALGRLGLEDADVQIVVSDGVNAEALHHNVPELLPVLLDGLASRSLKVGQPILLPYGRVKVAEAVGDALKPQLVINSSASGPATTPARPAECRPTSRTGWRTRRSARRRPPSAAIPTSATSTQSSRTSATAGCRPWRPAARAPSRRSRSSSTEPPATGSQTWRRHESEHMQGSSATGGRPRVLVMWTRSTLARSRAQPP
jgi:hypothetical protein